MAKNERNAIIRRCVRRIEAANARIKSAARERRAEYRHAKQHGIDPSVLHQFIRERAQGFGLIRRRRHAVAQLRRIVR